ncbi:MAG: DTW domain-containing protein, partial [Treponema sp.]|nr:DTW domain-containing protein [Treponema sp.]
LELPKMSFAGNYRSIFTFKHEPRPECVSTAETCYYLIKELQEAGLANPDANPEPLMTAFKKMISDQLRAENERVQGLRPSTHGYDWKYTKIKEDPFAQK